MESTSIKRIKFSYIPLSSGIVSVGAIVELANGIFEWDACPIGTTFTKIDPICLGIESANEIENKCNKYLVGANALYQIEIDEILESIFGDIEYGFSGVDYCISISCAIARCASIQMKFPLWKYINNLSEEKYSIPKILSNVIGGGGHHKNENKITETMVLGSNSVADDINSVLKIRQIFQSFFEKNSTNTYIGLEGCLVPDSFNEFELISEFCKILNNTNLKIGLDLAGIYDEYQLKKLLNQFPLIGYIEDPYYNNFVSENMMYHANNLLIAGDDLLHGNLELLEYYLKNNIINSAVFKLNHLGTISNIIKATKIARKHQGKIICSQRSNETSRDTMSHIAVGIGADYLKFGSPVRERIANYNNLLFIEKYVDNQ